ETRSARPGSFPRTRFPGSDRGPFHHFAAARPGRPAVRRRFRGDACAASPKGHDSGRAPGRDAAAAVPWPSRGDRSPEDSMARRSAPTSVSGARAERDAPPPRRVRRASAAAIDASDGENGATAPMTAETATPHRWRFYRVAGVEQVRLDTGDDIFHLDELDQKLWVALSCPVKGLQFDERTLALLDADGDGHVRPPEILEAVRWLRTVLKHGDGLLRRVDGVPLAEIRTDTAKGKALLA